MGRRRRTGRPVDGVLPLDKPTGQGSNEVLQRVKRLYQARKAGHTGNLDRLASGLLPVCFGEATKMSGFLLNSDKRYLASFRLGITTNTGDAEGEVTARCEVPALERAAIEGVLEGFRGEIEQIPPMHSAIKHRGQRLYKLAHQGLVVEREPRRVTVHEFRLLDLAPPLMHVEIACSKGTYVRTLAEDVGTALGCGAHVSALRRTAVGPFGNDDMVTLEELERRAAEGESLEVLLLPIESALGECPRVSLPENAAYYLRRGQPVLVAHAPTRGWVRIYAEPERFLGVGEVLDDGRIAPRRMIQG